MKTNVFPDSPTATTRLILRMNIKIYFLISWILLSRISVYFAVALDLEPWLPKSSELYLDTTNQLYVVQGIRVHKYPLQSKNLSSIRCMNFRSVNQLYAAGSGFIDVYSTETSESNFDTIQSFYNRAGNIHDFIFYEDSLLAITDNGLYKYLDNDFDARSDGEPELLISWKIQAGTQLSVTKSDSSIFYICGSWDTLDIPGKNQIEKINGIIEYLAEDNNVSVVAYGLNNPISLTSNLYHDLFCFDQGDANGFLLPHKKTQSACTYTNYKYSRSSPLFEGKRGRKKPCGISCFTYSRFRILCIQRYCGISALYVFNIILLWRSFCH